MEDNPIVEGAGGGDCVVYPNNSINPLNLSKRQLDANPMMAAALTEDPTLLKRVNKSQTFSMYRQKLTYSSEEKTSNETSGHLNRVKRDRAMIIRADKLVDNDGKKSNIVTMVKLLRKFLFHFKLF